MRTHIITDTHHKNTTHHRQEQLQNIYQLRWMWDKQTITMCKPSMLSSEFSHRCSNHRNQDWERGIWHRIQLSCTSDLRQTNYHYVQTIHVIIGILIIDVQNIDIRIENAEYGIVFNFHMRLTRDKQTIMCKPSMLSSEFSSSMFKTSKSGSGTRNMMPYSTLISSPHVVCWHEGRILVL